MTTTAPTITAENIILSATGVVYLVAADGTKTHMGRYSRPMSPTGYHIAQFGAVGEPKQHIEARNAENLKQLIADECN